MGNDIQLQDSGTDDQREDKVDDKTDQKAEDPKDKEKRIAKAVKDGLDPAKRVKSNLRHEWKRNVDLRLGKIATNFTGGLQIEDDVQTEINPDWSLTNTKTANLFSQVPNVQGTHENNQYAPAVAPFIKALNYELTEKRSNAGTAMEEVLNDVVNAAGVGAILVGYTARFATVRMPVEPQVQVPGMPQPIPTESLTDEQLAKLEQLGLVHMQEEQRVVSDHFGVDRISPNDLLWPSEYTRSDFNQANWVGYEGQAMWADAVHDFKLDPADKDRLLSGSEQRKDDETLVSQPDKGAFTKLPAIRYTRLFYMRARFDEDETYLNRIYELVYVDGKDDPVIHEPWKGQEIDDRTKHLIGCQIFPLQFLTLNYISDNPIPPSDTSAGRPQVNDLRKSRSQMFQMRDRSTPVRWYDQNRIDRVIGALLQRGSMNAFIPTNGDGSRAIGEIARASYPTEDFTFDQMAWGDLLDSWGLDPTQVGRPEGRKASAQANASQAARATRTGRERTRVGKFFLRVCEALAGLMALFGEFPTLTDQERQAMQKIWDTKHVISEVVLKIRPNSTIVLDPEQRVQKLMQFLNMTVKSGYINPKPILIEMAEFSDVNPNEVIVDPTPKPPDEPSISWRLTGSKDLQDPLVAAFLMKHKQMPSPEEITAAKKMLFARQQPLPPEEPQPEQGMGGPGAAGPTPPGPAAGPVQGAPHGEAHPQWALGARVAKRSRDVSGG